MKHSPLDGSSGSIRRIFNDGFRAQFRFESPGYRQNLACPGMESGAKSGHSRLPSSTSFCNFRAVRTSSSSLSCSPTAIILSRMIVDMMYIARYVRLMSLATPAIDISPCSITESVAERTNSAGVTPCASAFSMIWRPSKSRSRIVHERCATPAILNHRQFFPQIT